MNKDSAIDYLLVAHTALQSKDRIKCERLIKKAQNLCPDLNPRREDLVGSQCPLFSRFEDLDSILSFVAEYGQESTSSTSNHRKREPEPQETEEKNYTDEDVKDVKDLLAKQNDYYKVLGVEKTATADDIKRAYRKMAMKFHPDRNSVPHSSEAFKLVSAAYVTLSDSQKRKMYDHYGTDDPQHIHQHRSPFGQRMNVNGHTFTFGQDDDDIFFDLFANLFGGGMHPDVLQQRMRMRHQRQRQHQHVHRQQQMETNNGFGFYILQIGVILFIILSSVFNYSFFSSGNTHHETASSSFFSFQKSDHYPMMRYMHVSKSVSIPYFVTPYVNAQMNANHLAKKQVESQVYYNYEPYLQAKCKQEMHEKDQKAQAGSAARSGDERWKNMDAAEKMQLPSCEALRRFKAGNTH